MPVGVQGRRIAKRMQWCKGNASGETYRSLELGRKPGMLDTKQPDASSVDVVLA